MATPFPRPDKPVASASHPSLKDKVVLITGASSGIGAATAVRFAQNGARVALHGRNAERLQQVATLCQQAGLSKDKVFCVTGDVIVDADAEKIVNESVKKFGRLDVLINNAGFATTGNFDQCDAANLDHMYKTNMRSVYHITKVALPSLKESKGNIVVVSSVAGLLPMPSGMNYNLAKSMVQMFTRSLALELAKSGVRVNSVNPAMVRTSIYSREGGWLNTTETDKERAKKEDALYSALAPAHPLGRTGWPEEIAEGILFLASDSAAFMTGHALAMDGGLVLTNSLSAMT